MIKGFIKIFLFISSYIPLFLILGIKNHANRIFIYLDIGLIVTSVLFLIYIMIKATKMNGEYAEVSNVQDNSNKFIEYILAYIIPFLGFDLASPIDIISVLIIFLMIGVLYVKSDLIYMNPMLNFLGFNLYKVTSNNTELMLITRKIIDEKQKVRIFNIAKRVGVAK